MTVSYPTTCVEMETLDEVLKTLLTQTAEDLAWETGFIRRRRTLSGATYAQGLVFGWLAHPNASYTQLQQMLALLGCQISRQALEQRLDTPQSADFLQSLLYATLGHAVASPVVDTKLFEQFEGVYLQDGTVISLPNELQGLYKGFGGNTPESGVSALRVQVRLNLATGAMQGPWVQEAVTCERNGPGSLQQTPLPSNALYVVDSHYPTLRIMKEMTQARQWWLTHMKADLVLFDERGVRQSVPEFVARQQ